MVAHPRCTDARVWSSTPLSAAIALTVASGTPWIDLFAVYRVRRFCAEVWAVMAVSAFIVAFAWVRAERSSNGRSLFAFVLRSMGYAMACCAVATAAWVCRFPSAWTIDSLAGFAKASLLVALAASLFPVWLAPLLVVLSVLGAPLYCTQRAMLSRALSAPKADALVALCALVASMVFACLAWSDRVPSSLFATAYAPVLARTLTLAAVVANALVVIIATHRAQRARPPCDSLR